MTQSTLQKSKQVPDGELILLYQNGDHNAVGTLLFRHKNMMMYEIRKFIYDADEANDVFQDVAEKILIALRTTLYKEKNTFKAWAIRICHNYCLDMLRKKKKMQTFAVDESPELLDSASFEELTIEEVLIRNDRNAELWKHVDKLTAVQKQTLVMRYVEGKSFKEITDELGVNLNTALSRARYARLNLRDFYKIAS